MTTTTEAKTTAKRHRWPKHDHPGECRNGDRCLDCGTDLNDAKRGGQPCASRALESLGNGWHKDGKNILYIGEPGEFLGDRAMIALQRWTFPSHGEALRLIIAELDATEDPGDPKARDDALADAVVMIDLPTAAVVTLFRILGGTLDHLGLLPRNYDAKY